MPAAHDLVAVVAVVRALRTGPVTMPAIAEQTGIGEYSVRRIVARLEEAKAPIQREVVEHAEGAGRPPIGLRLTVEGLREWLG